MRELIKGGSLMCTGGSQKRIDGPHSVKYSRLSGVLEITCPERGNHGFGQIMIAAEPPS